MTPFETVVLDDCSTDSTVRILIDYLNSGLCSLECKCRVVVNEVNLGIARNMTKAAQLVEGNVTTIMSGDDLIAPGTFEAVDTAIRRQGFDVNSDLFVAFSPTVNRSQEGDRAISYRIISDSPIKTMVRKTAPFVKVGFSAALMRQAIYPHVRGVWADWIWDLDLCVKAVGYYEIPIPCYIHTEIGGVSTSTPQEQIRSSYLQSSEYTLSNYGTVLSFSDKLYLKGEVCSLRGRLQGSVVDKSAGFFLAVLNVWNFGGIIGLKSVAERYLPVAVIRNIRRRFA